MSVCGTNGINCCPILQSASGKCNQAHRYKLTPGQSDGLIPTTAGWTNVNPGGLKEEDLMSDLYSTNAQIPKGLIPGSTGELKYIGTKRIDKVDPGAQLFPEFVVCGARDKRCYEGYRLSDAGAGTSNINKLDEYYTACGYGWPPYWPKGELRQEGEDSGPYSVITDGVNQDGGGCNAPFPEEEGYKLIDHSECDLYNEMIEGSHKSIVGKKETRFGRAATYEDGDKGCHYKYRRDWSNPMFNFPPRFTTANMNGISSFFDYAGTAGGVSWQIPMADISDQIDPITNGPKARMECCTGSVNSEGVFKPKDSASPASYCPLTENAMDHYTNYEIENYGAGVYDPFSNVCARYTPTLDGPDTPENWCSYNIVRDNFRWNESDNTPVVNMVQGGFIQWNEERYPRYMNLLLHGPCNQWLDLDYNPHATDSRMKDDDDLPRKPRSKALGQALTNFFIWVSGHLADPLLTPAPDETIGLRSDLIQAESKYNEAGANTNVRIQGLLLHNETCPSGTSYAPIYVGEYGEDSRKDTCNDMRDIMAGILPPAAVEQCTLDPTSTDVGGTGHSCLELGLPDGGCDIVDATAGWKGGLCHVDPISPSPSPSSDDPSPSPGGGREIECTNKYYSKNVSGELKYFPCYQYDGQEDDKWYKNDFYGSKVESDAPTSSSGCGYYPETLPASSMSPGTKNEHVRTYLENLSSSPTGQDDLQEIIDSNSPGMDESIAPSPPDKDDLINIILASGIFDFLVPGGGNVSECIGDTTSGDRGCCNYLNKDEFSNKDKTTSSSDRLKNLVGDQEKVTLFDTNFDATTPLGQFLNFLTTKQAGAFLHHSHYSRNNDNNAFLINMKKFCARTDIFNWKQPDPVNDTTEQTEFKKQYNKLLEARYSKICSCFWPKGDIEKPVEMREEGNPVKEWYKNYMRVNQCVGINSQSPCGNHCILSEDEQEECLSKSVNANGMMTTIISFFDSKDPVEHDRLNIDNSCWYHTCSSANSSNDNYLMKKEYGLTTKFTAKPRGLPECTQGSCKYLCVAENILKYDTINMKDSTIEMKINACNSRSPSLPPADSNSVCGSHDDFVIPEHKSDRTDYFGQQVRGGGPSPPPSPSPSPSGDDSSSPWEWMVYVIWIIVGVLLLIAAIVIVPRVLTRFSSSKDSSGGEETLNQITKVS